MINLPRSPATRLLRRLALAFAALGLVVGAAFLVLRQLVPEPIATLTVQGSRFLEEHPGALRREHGLQVARAPAPPTPEASLYFIHGSPGDWQAFAAYLRDPELTRRFRLIAPDRPGYGGSDPGSPVPDLAEQAARLAVLARNDPAPRIWVGHSFGATILAQLAVDSPELADGLLFIGGAMSAEYEPVRWFHRLADHSPMRGWLPPEWHSANQEAIGFEAGMEELRPRWNQIACPVYLLHARNDRLADFRHVAFTVEQMAANPPTVIALERGDHFVLWTRYEKTKAILLQLADEVTGES